jgi:hypothetical protein
MKLRVVIDGVNYTHLARLKDTRVTKELTNYFTTAELTFVDGVGVDAQCVFQELDAIFLDDPDTAAPFFGGRIATIDRTWLAPGKQLVKIGCQDWSALLDQVTVTATFGAQTDRAFIQTLFTTYFPGFPFTYPDAQIGQFITLTNGYEAKDESIRSIIQKVCGMASAEFRIDPAFNVYYFRPAAISNPAPFNLSSDPDNSTTFPFREVSHKTIFTNAANSITFIGGIYPLTGTELVETRNDTASQAVYGTIKATIVDREVIDPVIADLRADAEVARRAWPEESGQFIVYKDGLEVGQTIHLTSSQFDFDDDYVIRTIGMEWVDKGVTKYTVEYGEYKPDLLRILQLLGDRTSEPTILGLAIPPDGSVTTPKLASQAVVEAKLAVAAVTATILATGAVTETKIASDAVTTPKIVANAITSAKIGAGEVIAGKIAAGAVVAGNIAAGSISAANAVFAAGAIGTADIGTAVITSAKIGNLEVKTANYDNLSITDAKIANLTITAAKIGNAEITGTKIASATIQTANIADLAVANAKIDSLAVTTLKLDGLAVTKAKLANASVDGFKIEALAIGSGHIQNAQILTAHIADANITTAKIGDLQVNTAKIVDLNVTSLKIGGLAVVTSKIDNAAVGNSQLGTNAVNTSNLVNGAVDGFKIQTGAIGNVHIQNANILTAHIQNAAITDAKIADVSAGKLTAGTINVASPTTPTIVVKYVSGSNAVTIHPNGLELRDGSNTLYFNATLSGISASVAIGTSSSINANQGFTVNGLALADSSRNVYVQTQFRVSNFATTPGGCPPLNTATHKFPVYNTSGTLLNYAYLWP